jgi:hypothetical protein
MTLCLSKTEANPKDSVLRVKKVNDFEVRGDGSASEWARTEWATLTRSKGESNYTTKFKTVYSDKGIYCLFVCEDSKITSTLREDFADLYKEDVIEAFFWTDESRPIYFEYELSPTNYELPIIIPNYEGDFFGWRPWHYEGDRKTRHATNIVKENEIVTSWTAEFFIPFALLKPLQNSPPKKGTRWRANFYRIDYDENYTSWAWKSVLKNFHDYKRFGVIEFE